MISGNLEALQRTKLFQEVDASELVELAARSVRREYVRGQVIEVPDSDKQDVVAVSQGEVGLFRSSAGREIRLTTLRPNDVFPLSFANHSDQPNTVIRTLADRTVLHFIPSRYFEQFVVSHPAIALTGMRLVSRRLIDTFDLVEDLAFRPVHVRLAHVLARLARSNHGGEITTTHEELAIMIGSSREEVTKTLQTFRAQGLVEYRRHHNGMVVPEPDTLISISIEDLLA